MESMYVKTAEGCHYLTKNEFEKDRNYVNFVISERFDYSLILKEKNQLLDDIRKHERKIVLEEIKNGKIKIE